MGNTKAFCVVGIGGSNGAYIPLQTILGALDGTDIACVVDLSGHPEVNRSLTEALRASIPAGFAAAIDGAELKPGFVYVVPPGHQATVENGCLKLRTRSAGSGRSHPIDRLFRSIANDAGQRSVGIILSGEGSDGALALTAINEAGGLTMAQSPESAAHPNLPQAAIDMGYVDMVLPPEEMAKALITYVGEFGNVDAGEQRILDNRAISEICDILRTKLGCDFKQYNVSTLNRRIQRRMGAIHCRSANDYILYIRDNADEPRLLMRDLLVGVTSFFRDPEAYAFLREHVLLPLMQERGPEQTIRIWVPGCSTGQEAYSLALLAEELRDKGRGGPSVQIFATDLDDRAISIARRGSYPANIAAEMSPERIERFFDRTGRRFQVKKSVRQTVTFCRHDLIGDPPFSHMDLISCRNVLIYLGQHLQKKLISVFHYALKEEGYLFLGASEAVSGHPDLFRVIEPRFRIGQRKPTALRTAAAGRSIEPMNVSVWQQPANSESADLGGIAQRILLDEFAPPYAVVNEEAQVVYLSAGADQFLRPPEGQFTNNIVRMVQKGLRARLRTAWQRSVDTRRTATYEGVYTGGGEGSKRVRLVVQPMPELGKESGLYMVVFQDLGSLEQSAPEAGAAYEGDSVVDRLEAELIQTRDELERAIQDLEAANEELKSSNEELLSMNEELQSANEELLASKEEVESARLRLSANNMDLENLLRSTEIATIFLDAEGHLRTFTPLAAEYYNITFADIGRPLSHFTHCFVDNPPMISGADVPEGAVRQEDEVLLASGRALLRRVTPYRDAGGAAAGVVITFVDITEQKEVQKRLRQAEVQASERLAELETIYKQAPVGLTMLDRELRYVRINEALAEMNGASAADHIGRTVREIVPALADQVEPVFHRIMATGETVGPFELLGETAKHPGEQRAWLETWAPVEDAGGKIIGVSISAFEITEQKRQAQAVIDSEARLRRVLDNLFAFVGALTLEGVLVEVNDAPLKVAGLTRDDVIGKPFANCYWWSFAEDSQERIWDAVRRAATGEVLRFDAQVQVRNRQFITIDFQLSPLRDGDGRIVELIASGVDISARQQAELALARSEARYRGIFENLAVSLWQDNLSGVVRLLDKVCFNVGDDLRSYLAKHPEFLLEAAGAARIEAVNPFTLSLFEASDREELLSSLPRLMTPQTEGVLINALVALWSGQRILQAETTLSTLRGRRLDVIISVAFQGARGEHALVSILDRSDEKAAERKLAENQERLHLAVIGAGLGTWDIDLRTDRIVWSKTHFALLGYPEPEGEHAEVDPKMWQACVHPDDAILVKEAYQRARAEAGVYVIDHRIIRADTREVRWLSSHGRFLADHEGKPYRFIGVFYDITERKRAEMHEKMLLRELSHRVKNSLATIQALASLTSRNATSLNQFRETFIGRLHAIAAAHDILTSANWIGASLKELVERQVCPYASVGRGRGRVRLSGPRVILLPQQAQLLGLILHELATNAAKYGALSLETGEVDISWSLNGEEPTVVLIWVEKGGPIVVPPEQSGFGTQLIQRSLESSLNGAVSLMYEPEGLRAELTFPLSPDEQDPPGVEFDG